MNYYWLYYFYGSCNDGSCGYGFERFDSLAGAQRRAAKIMRDNATEDPSCEIICGQSVPVTPKEFAVQTTHGTVMSIAADSQIEAENIAVRDGHMIRRVGGKVNETIEPKGL